ncbi:amidohydrolase family protein [Sphingomonas sp. H39-1-10]|uniref:amidohydrolase family protein n=1 Tax=Sphingomonas pollutisoli TaxID=3030829 RepID=UPI0023B95C9E|nr:amidohydrolase family protein [Sphingomonas pollutisoli]MDF0487146.1 amidohydrolase family protein [Sphingomonas pollutisoli]
MMRLIDAHQHFWSLATVGHEWPTAAEADIHRDFGPDDLVMAAAGLPLTGSVLVQSQPTDTDTDWMLALAERTPLVQAVVGWVDLAHAQAPERILALAERPKLRGLRPMLQSIADTDWLLQDALVPALEAMRTAGLRLDALVQPRHLPMLARFAERWPDLPIVIDHAAKPYAATATLDPWRDDIAALASLGLHCKMSGLRTEQAPGQPAEDLMPYVEHLVRAFGARLMWGSDWPVLLLSGDAYRHWHDDALRLAARAGADLERLFAGAAIDFYALETADAA